MSELISTFDFVAFLVGGCALATAVGLAKGLQLHAAQISGLRGSLAREHELRQQIEQDFKALLTCSRNMGQQIRNKKVEDDEPPAEKTLNFRFDPIENESGDKVHELVKRGLSVEEIASVCGLTRGEVDFMSRFFGASGNA